MRNGFMNAKNKTEVHMIANCQTFLVGSLYKITQGEINHIDTIAQMYYQKNKPTAESEKIVQRDSIFFGGRQS